MSANDEFVGFFFRNTSTKTPVANNLSTKYVASNKMINTKTDLVVSENCCLGER